jgi:hypothetical protein
MNGRWGSAAAGPAAGQLEGLGQNSADWPVFHLRAARLVV